ncbi:MAG: hypothetical protein PVH03_01505, partial [Chloroflexota bacterium]
SSNNESSADHISSNEASILSTMMLPFSDIYLSYAITLLIMGASDHTIRMVLYKAGKLSACG